MLVNTLLHWQILLILANTDMLVIVALILLYTKKNPRKSGTEEVEESRKHGYPIPISIYRR